MSVSEIKTWNSRIKHAYYTVHKILQMHFKCTNSSCSLFVFYYDSFWLSTADTDKFHRNVMSVCLCLFSVTYGFIVVQKLQI